MTASALGSPTRSGVALAGYLTALCSSLLTWETAATGLGRWSHRSTMGGSGGEAHDWHPYPHPGPEESQGISQAPGAGGAGQALSNQRL